MRGSDVFSEVGQTEALGGLDELIGRRFLVEEVAGRQAGSLSPGVTYSFSHEKIRQVAYTEGGQARRAVLHRRAFEMLEERGAPAAQPRHALATGLAGAAFAYSVAAGDDAVEVFAARDAVAHYERARILLAERRTNGGRLVEPSIDVLQHLYVQLGQAREMADEREEA